MRSDRRDYIDALPPLPRKYTREEAIAALEELYAQLPALECKGLCHDSCTTVDASELERQRAAEAGRGLGPAYSYKRLQLMIADGNKPRCPSLGPLNNCTIYAVRPFICRVFGMARGLRCDHGCIPDGILEDGEVVRAFAIIEQLSRLVTGVRSNPPIM